MGSRYLSVLLAGLLASTAPLHADIRLPNAFSDHAVLQRGVPIRIWGWATPGAKLTVEFHAQTVVTAADRLGEWTAWLMPESAGGPYTLTVKGDAAEGSRTISDILIGDVWLASGQSNMEIPLIGFPPDAPIKNGPAEIAAVTNPNIHPADKQTVAARLALAARGMVYGEDVEFHSPLFREATTQSGGMRVWFDHAKGLTTHGKKLEGFEIAGADRQFVPAEAEIDGDTVIVKNSGVSNPVFVRYGWSGVAPPSLYNAAGLPASTFSSEPVPSY